MVKRSLWVHIVALSIGFPQHALGNNAKDDSVKVAEDRDSELRKQLRSRGVSSLNFNLQYMEGSLRRVNLV